MAKNQIIAGIDVGTCKITTLIASCDEKREKIHVIGVASEESKGLRKSQVVDIEEAIEAITQSVEAAERMAGYSISSSFVSLGGAHIESQNSKGVVAISHPEEEIIGEDVERVIEAARAISLPSSREIVHVIPREFIVDSQKGIKDPLGMTGVRLEAEAHLITGSSTAMRNLAKCISEIGIDVVGLVFSGLASAEAVLTETEKELGVCLIDLGGGTTSLAVFIEGALGYSSVLPIGAKNVTNDLAIGLRVSLDSAEKIKFALSEKEKGKAKKAKVRQEDEIDLGPLGLKEEVGKASYKTLVEGIIRPRLNEIFELVGEELKKSGYGGATPAGVVITGGGAETVGIASSCKRVLSLPVRIGYPQGLTGLIEEINSPMYATAQGLITYGLKNLPLTAGGRGLPALGKIMKKIPIRGVVEKTIDFIKSFLP